MLVLGVGGWVLACPTKRKEGGVWAADLYGY